MFAGIERILGSHAPVKSSHGPVDPASLDLPEGNISQNPPDITGKVYQLTTLEIRVALLLKNKSAYCPGTDTLFM